jgi:hypothetical protein
MGYWGDYDCPRLNAHQSVRFEDEDENEDEDEGLPLGFRPLHKAVAGTVGA